MNAKTKKTIWLLFAAIAVLLLAGSTFAVAVWQRSYASATLSEVDIENEYALGTVFTVPDATLTVGGSTVAAESELVLPSAEATRLKEIKLDRVGHYELRYRAEVSGTQYSVSKHFEVYDALYSVSSVRSSAMHGECTYFGDSLKTDGLAVALAPGDTFTYHKPIDLRQLALGEDVARVRITPQVRGEKDFSELFIVLTDAYNPENTVTVAALAHYNTSTFGYFKTAANGQSLTGYEQRTGLVHVSNIYGFPVYLAFNGNPAAANPSNAAAFRLDIGSGAVETARRNGTTDLVANLKDPFFFPNPWKGFETGEVYVSIRAGSYEKQSAVFFVEKIGHEDLAGKRFTDEVKPGITVDLEGYNEDALPTAVVGRPYRLFDATALDAVSGRLSPLVRVYRDYYSAVPKNVSVSSGAFVPSVPGRYTIEYSATDGAGNEATYLLNVTAAASVTPLAVNIQGTPTTSAIYGEVIKVADCVPSGGSGNIEVTVNVVGGGRTIETRPGGSFSVTVADNYIVKYTAVDRAGNSVETQYEVSVTAGSRPVFVTEPTLPKYLLAGQTHILPAHTAFNYTDGSGTVVTTKIRVTDANGTRTLSGNNYIPPVSSSGGTVTIEYVAALGESETVLTYTLPVYNTFADNVPRIEQYFVCDGASSVLDEQNERVVFTGQRDGGEAEFINPIVADGFSARFSLVTQSAARALTIVLEDYEDASVAIGLTLTRGSGNSAAFLVSGDDTRYEIRSASFTNGREFFLNYFNSSRRVLIDADSGMSATVSKTLQGEVFNGFPSGKVYVKFCFEGGANALSVQLKSLNTQAMKALTYVSSRPQIGYEVISGDFLPGERVTVKASAAADMLDPYVEFHMTVTAPSGAAAVSDDGITLEKVDPRRDYELTLNEYGSYVVTFYARNSYGRAEADLYYAVRVVDRTPPVITVPEGIAATVRVGASVYVPKATATDDMDSEVTVKTYVITPRGVMVYLDLEAGDGFVANLSGVYTVRYIAYDIAGNMSVVDRKVTVQ